MNCKKPINKLFIFLFFTIIVFIGIGIQGNTSIINNNDTVLIKINASEIVKPLPFAWPFFGNDEANWAYTPNGKKLLKDLDQLSPVPIKMRAHHLFTSGDPADTRLKWSPSGVYEEDHQGNTIYNWENIDRLFDTYLKYNIHPYIEIGFMPRDLSVQPEPYNYVFKERHMKDFGHVYPPKDYDKWADLVRNFIRHLKDRYGQQQLETWYWEVWNEPDIFFWQGTTEEYLKLYDYTAWVVREEIPNALLGGPTSTAPTNEKSAQFLRDFLQHVATGTNYVSGRKGSPLDFISIHSKGRVHLEAGKVRMGMQRHLARLNWAFQVISEFPELKKLPVLIGESDPEGTAAYNIANRPENIYRQGPIYPAYNITVLNKIHQLADQYDLNIMGNLTWAFHFEGSEYFEGFRELATNGINKAVLNGFRMLGMMHGQKLSVHSDHQIDIMHVVDNGFSSQAEISAMASVTESEISVLVWNYHDYEEEVIPAPVKIRIDNLPDDGKVLIEHFRVDQNHGNPYRLWLEMGTPTQMSPQQMEKLHNESEIPLYESPKYLIAKGNSIQLSTKLPRFGLSLYKISW